MRIGAEALIPDITAGGGAEGVATIIGIEVGRILKEPISRHGIIIIFREIQEIIDHEQVARFLVGDPLVCQKLGGSGGGAIVAIDEDFRCLHLCNILCVC
uniref:Uncharacterized protein n=1 Tax=Rhizophora mucronata TaxID=61149 RepID=A0A2P2NG89_RHIMU